MLVLAGLLLSLFYLTNGLYSSSSNVITLTSSNFNSLVERSDEIWVVEFFAPWCGHCQALVPEFTKAATALKGVIKVGAVNCDNDQSLAGRFGVQGFPTIKIFGADKSKPIEYAGSRTAQGIIDSALDAARKKISENLSGKRSKRASNNENVVVLTDSNFDSTVYGSNDYWIIDFFKPGCGHCDILVPEWAEAATQLKGKAKFGSFDVTSQSATPSKYHVKGVPAIFCLKPGAKSQNDAIKYDGGRTSGEIVKWVLDTIERNTPPPDIIECLHDDMMREQCLEKQLCVVSFLPQLLDCQSKCRNDYIEILKKVSEKFKTKSWGWVWFEGCKQEDLEDSMDIGGFGYPAMVVLNSKKQKYSILKRPFSETGIYEFLRELSMGRGQTQDLKSGLPKVVETKPWDGKDQEVPDEEDIDLSDVILDDIKEEL